MLWYALSFLFFVQSFADYEAHYSGFKNVTVIYRERWFAQEVDHFVFRTSVAGDDGGRWKQRYFVNTDHVPILSSGSSHADFPIFFYAGNEDSIETFISASGALYFYASKAQAAIVFAEHRYYGASFPVSPEFPRHSLTPQNISGLTIEQALADYVALANHLRIALDVPNAPIIAFGGSYGGALAAFLRQKYPFSFAGAVASSASLAKHRFSYNNHFARHVTDVYAAARSGCADAVRQAVGFLLAAVPNPTRSQEDVVTYADLNRVFRLCPDSLVTSHGSLTNLYSALMGGVETMVQYGYPYPSRFAGPVRLPAYPFRVVCDAAAERAAAGEGPLAALIAAAEVFWGVKLPVGQSVRIVTPHSLVAPTNLNKTAECIDLAAGSGLSPFVSLAWSYQTCTEVWQPMATDGVSDFYAPAPVNETALFETCRTQWNVKPRPTWWEEHFGGCNVSAATNIFFPYGSLDPWSEGGCSSMDRSGPGNGGGIRVVTMQGAAHHLDLRWPNDADPPDVVRVRGEIAAAIGSWVGEWKVRRVQP
eukprot:TRINITY_DN70173_c0_g1_i1.p1 TRINITY_DN70173_c0_g1~~TRINITY_DN70173_c0_g1_i1.p1  ORF type:complete len:535 (-),score=30.64 TRINITY_DN70173_c0_g1_i1:154-1758(-)